MLLQWTTGCTAVFLTLSGHSFLPSGENFGVDQKQKMKYESVFTIAEWMVIAKPAKEAQV